MKSFLLTIFTLGSLLFYAQHASCDGSRYYSAQYSVDSTLGVVFGNSTTQGGVNADLKFDFFEPAGDVAINRPLIILAFGGSFISGTREDMHSYCAYYASKGFACATIDYSLYFGPLFPIPDSITMTDEVIKAVSDMKAAIRYFREDAATTNQFKIDSNLIFVGGISAGSIVGLHAGMLQETNTVQPYIDSILTENGGWTGNSSTNFQYGDQVAGIINYSGALKWASYVDANDPPVFSVHDDDDGTVPYASGSASIFGFPIIDLEGSSLIHAKAQSEGVTSELITIPNSSGHVSYFGTQAGADSILLRSLEFVYPLICNQLAPVGINEVTLLKEMELYPNPAMNQVQLELSTSEKLNLSIFDITGRVVLTEKTNGIATIIDVSNLLPGNYFIEVKSLQGIIEYERKQFVKL